MYTSCRVQYLGTYSYSFVHSTGTLLIYFCCTSVLGYILHWYVLVHINIAKSGTCYMCSQNIDYFFPKKIRTDHFNQFLPYVLVHCIITEGPFKFYTNVPVLERFYVDQGSYCATQTPEKPHTYLCTIVHCSNKKNVAYFSLPRKNGQKDDGCTVVIALLLRENPFHFLFSPYQTK